MIGVVASPADLDVAAEFFELFKTPWEPAVQGRRYRLVLSCDGRPENIAGDTFLVYGSTIRDEDREAAPDVECLSGPSEIAWQQSSLPIYGRLCLFGDGCRQAILQSRGKAADLRVDCRQIVVQRIGYDLFREVHQLLTKGQPTHRAATPTLELHIALLRFLILQAGVSFVEIPPQPQGYDYTCCLTHDVDFFGIRRHGFDRTLAGFILRASLGTIIDSVRGRRSVAAALRNFGALLSLPFVFAGLADDFWKPFDDYARIEDGSQSTFFLVPFKGRPGTSPDGTIDVHRAVPYEVSEIRPELAKAAARGSELALHGIDAWRDSDAGIAERTQLQRATGSTEPSVGVRMHWLYFAEESPAHLEAAGFSYDSTWGYNEAVGYRAGTSQVFRLGATDLMELPLAIMDTALLYPGRMHLDPAAALEHCQHIIANAMRFGGTIVINWHERSLAPERLWGSVYEDLLRRVNEGRVWFARASQAVEWFRWRRSIRFVESTPHTVTITAPIRTRTIPAAAAVCHRPSSTSQVSAHEHRVTGHETIRVEL